MATSSESSSVNLGIGIGSDNIYHKELKNLPVESRHRRGSGEEARDDLEVPPTQETEKNLGRVEVSSSTEFLAGLQNLLSAQEKGDGPDAVDCVTKGGGETINSTGPAKETIFRKELTKLIVGTASRRASRDSEMTVADNEIPSTREVHETIDTKEVKTVTEIATDLENILKDQEEVKKEKGGDFLTKVEANNVVPSKETIYRKELKNLEVRQKEIGEEVKDGVQGPPVEQIEGKSEFKGVSSIVGSKTELKSVAIIQEKVRPEKVAEISTNTEPETVRKEEPTPIEGKGEFKEVASTVRLVSELRSVAINQEKTKIQDLPALLRKTEPEIQHTGRLISVLKTVREGEVEDEATVRKGLKETTQKTKSLSTGALELKLKAPSFGEGGSSFERLRKRSHVPLSVLERMEKDPIVAQHFAQLESPTEETISDSSDNSKRYLHTTSRLRRTTDSVGLKYVNQYIVIKVLGFGTYGKVKLCLNTMDCKLYAVKIVHRKWLTRRSIGGTTENVGQGAMREIAIMKKLNHPNIVALYEVIDDPSKRKLYLVLEYVEGGPIMGNAKWRPFPEDKARLYFRDMCKGIDYLHFNKVVHRDLKPGNLLQTLDGHIKISDFGVSHMFEQESDSMQDTAGTPAFLAPEVCSGGECQGRPADLWSLGVCLYVMVFAKIPFPADSITDMYQAIMHKETLILTKDPSMRISLAGIMQHDWVTKDGSEPLFPFKVQVARGSTVMSVTEDEVKAAIGVNEAGLAALCNVNPVEKEFEEGEYIIRQGDEGNEMYFINRGQCEVLVESRSLTQPSRGRMEYAVAERGPGQYIGEMELQKDPSRKPPRRNASIRAKTRVVALVVSREQVMEVLSKNAEAAQSMADTIAERDRELQMKLRALDLRMPSMRLEKEEEQALQPQETCSSCRCF